MELYEKRFPIIKLIDYKLAYEFFLFHIHSKNRDLTGTRTPPEILRSKDQVARTLDVVTIQE